MAYSLCEKALSLTPYDPVEGIYRVPDGCERIVSAAYR